jgi:CHAT domain-containing protein
VATHSIKKENNPKLSGLIFAQSQNPSEREDGILYSGETYNLNLNAELIVLSSCESGIGKLVKGEGMLALNRGFLYSGVQNTIFSLWKVEDKSTSRLMIELYRNILEGKSFSTALRRAKLQLIQDPFTAFPRYWSGFILVGE